MALVSVQRGETILDTHVNQFTTLLSGTSGGGQDVRLTQQTNAADYANIFGNVDATNGYAAKFQFGPVASPTTLMTVSKATGVAITQNNASVYGLSVTQSNATNLIQKWVDSSGNTTMIVTNTGLFSATDGVGIAIGNALGNAVIKLYKTSNSLGAGDDYILGDYSLLVNSSGGDHAVFRAVGSETTGDSGIRAGEFHVTRPTGKTAAYGFNGITVGCHSMTPGGSDTSLSNTGVYVMATTPDWAGNTGAAVPQDIGVWVSAHFDGWKDYFRATGTVAAGHPEHFRVAGGVRSGDLAGDVVSLNRFRSGNGSAASPAITPDATKNVGIFFASSGQTLNFSTAGTQRMNISSAGSVVVGIAALATNATDGFLYIPTCAGAPTGTPTSLPGLAPLIYDSTNHKIWFYSGSWRGVVVT